MSPLSSPWSLPAFPVTSLPRYFSCSLCPINSRCYPFIARSKQRLQFETDTDISSSKWKRCPRLLSTSVCPSVHRSVSRLEVTSAGPKRLADNGSGEDGLRVLLTLSPLLSLGSRELLTQSAPSHGSFCSFLVSRRKTTTLVTLDDATLSMFRNGTRAM